MRIEKCSNQTFGAVTNKMDDTAFELMKRIKGKKIAEYRDLLESQNSNPVNVEFFFNERNRLCAKVNHSESGYNKTFKKGLLSGNFGFVKKMFKKADKINYTI